MVGVRAVVIVVLLLAWVVLAVPLTFIATRLGLPLDAALQRKFCRSLLRVLGVGLSVDGLCGGGARLLVANHISWIDVLVLGAVEPLCFLAKREVGAWPLIGSLARQQGTVFVDRRRRRGIPAVNRAMAERLREGRSVLLFPEGTTHDGTALGRIHTAHLACLREQLRVDAALKDAPVQAVRLSYSDPAAAWIGDDTLLPHIWAVLKRPPITCTLRYGERLAVVPGHDRKALGRVLAEALAVPVDPCPAPAPREPGLWPTLEHPAADAGGLPVISRSKVSRPASEVSETTHDRARTRAR